MPSSSSVEPDGVDIEAALTLRNVLSVGLVEHASLRAGLADGAADGVTDVGGRFPGGGRTFAASDEGSGGKEERKSLSSSGERERRCVGVGCAFLLSRRGCLCIGR